MATISNITVCSGGNHISMTVTTAEGSRDVHTSLSELRTAMDEVGKREFILRQIGSIVRSNPNDTPVERRNRLQTATYLE
jgi:hypothetical protein